MSFCPYCGNQIADGARFCGSCGAQMQARQQATAQAQAPVVAAPVAPVAAAATMPSAAAPVRVKRYIAQRILLIFGLIGMVFWCLWQIYSVCGIAYGFSVRSMPYVIAFYNDLNHAISILALGLLIFIIPGIVGYFMSNHVVRGAVIRAIALIIVVIFMFLSAIPYLSFVLGFVRISPADIFYIVFLILFGIGATLGSKGGGVIHVLAMFLGVLGKVAEILMWQLYSNSWHGPLSREYIEIYNSPLRFAFVFLVVVGAILVFVSIIVAFIQSMVTLSKAAKQNAMMVNQ